MIEHFLGGVWVASLMFCLMRNGSSPTFLYILGFVAFIGVGWEFFEFILDRYITMAGYTYLPGVYEDTLSDLFFDLFGGSFAYILYIL